MKPQDITAALTEAFLDEGPSVVAPAGALDAAFADAFGDEAEQDARADQRARKSRQRKRVAEGVAFVPMSAEEKKAKQRERRIARQQERAMEDAEWIAVLDMETDPFDNGVRDRIFPFVACLYSDRFEPVFIWEEDNETFIDKVIAAINALGDRAYTIYAHNGGKFDWLFLLKRLRGNVSFKGRGIMSAQIGIHTIRDSFHLIPEKLAAYHKEAFDYSKNRKAVRHNHKDEIIRYLLSDCVYLFDIIKPFVERYGLKISIGQAAMMLLKREYPEVQHIKEKTDAYLRDYFFGGRVECLQGRGSFEGDYKLYDVNSMYPDVMSRFRHPIGNRYVPRLGDPGPGTCFVNLSCRSRGAFPVKRENEGTIFPHEFGRYRVSIHEYEMALKHGLIDNVKIHYVIDNEHMTTFEKFVLPLYQARQKTKPILAQLEAEGREESAEYLETKKDNIFLKLLMNNAYGKFAQNPRRFKEHYLTDFDEAPPEGEGWGGDNILPDYISRDYAIWSRPLPRLRFNNVGTAASITGAARAVLMDAIARAEGAIYCDTDSIICRSLEGVFIDKEALGAWDLEAALTKVKIAGKKLYEYQKKDGKTKIKSKGTSGVTSSLMDRILAGESVTMPAKAPTINRTGTQLYIDRTIRATAKERV